MRAWCSTIGPVRVHLAATADWSRAELDDRCARWLAPQERERAAAFRVDQARREYLLARVLLRRSLGVALGCEPSEVQLERGPRGQPLVRAGDRALGASSSHAQGLVACALAWECALGVDLEALAGRGEELRPNPLFFDAQELAEAARLGEPAGAEHLVRCWTLKEAYAKARGLGMRVGPGRVGCRFGPDGRPELRLDPSLEDEGGRWRVHASSPVPGHALAVVWAPK